MPKAEPTQEDLDQNKQIAVDENIVARHSREIEELKAAMTGQQQAHDARLADHERRLNRLSPLEKIVDFVDTIKTIASRV